MCPENLWSNTSVRNALCLQPRSQHRISLSYKHQNLTPNLFKLTFVSQLTCPPHTKQCSHPCHISCSAKMELTHGSASPSPEQGREGAPSARLALLEQPEGWSAAGSTDPLLAAEDGLSA